MVRCVCSKYVLPSHYTDDSVKTNSNCGILTNERKYRQKIIYFIEMKDELCSGLWRESKSQTK